MGWVGLAVVLFGCAAGGGAGGTEIDPIAQRQSALGAGAEPMAAMDGPLARAAQAAVADAGAPSPQVTEAPAPAADAGPAPVAADAGLPPGFAMVLGHQVNVAWLEKVGDTESQACHTDADCPISGWCAPTIHDTILMCAKQDPNGYLAPHSACNADDECSQLEGAAVCRPAAYAKCPGAVPTHAQCCEPGADGAPCFAADPVDPNPCSL